MPPFHSARALRRATAAGTLVAASLAGACADVPSPVAPDAARPEVAVAAGPGRIAFTSYRTGNGEIFVINGDGSGTPVNVTQSPSDDRVPAWSPDGSRIAFASDRAGSAPEIYVMSANGSNVVRLAPGLSAWDPTWSPDGRRVAFSGFDGTSFEIYVVNVEGTGLRKLTSTPSSSEFHPSWAARGGRIAFHSQSASGSDIYAMNADGSRVTRLTTDPGADMDPAWSPDGRHIAFVSQRGGSSYRELYVMDARGRRQTQVTHDLNILQPVWSPAGDRIAFMDQTDPPNPELAVVKTDGTGYVNLTNSAMFDGEGSWTR